MVCSTTFTFRTSDGYVQHAFDLLMKQLKVKHSEVRFSVYQMIDELFQRSHMFRELLLEELQTFLGLTTGENMIKNIVSEISNSLNLFRALTQEHVTNFHSHSLCHYISRVKTFLLQNDSDIN